MNVEVTPRSIFDLRLAVVHSEYTGQTGLPYFDRAAVMAIGSWYYDSALNPMRGNLTFPCRLINIGHTQ